MIKSWSYRAVAVGLLAGGVLLAATGGCRRSDERTADGRIIVTYWEKWTGFERDAMQAVVDDFNRSQTRLEVRMLTVSTVEQKFMMATAGGNPPDVVGLWSPSVNVYSEKGALTPLDKLAAEAGLAREQYIPVYWDLCRHRDFLWALPSTPATVALHWNKRLFREAGLDPERPPRTLAELATMNERLTIVEIQRNGKLERVRFPDLTAAERASHQFEIAQLGFTPAEPGWWNPMWVYWFGGDLWNGRDRVTPATPENLAMMNWYRGYADTYGLENLRRFGSSFGNFSSPQNPFLAEKIAMVLQGVWMYNFIDKYAPTIEWGAAAMPAAGDGTGAPVTIAETDVLAIPRGARHPREGFAFIRYVNTQPVLEKLNLAQRKFSPLAVQADAFRKAHPNPTIDVFRNLAFSPAVRIAPRLVIWNEYAIEMNVAMDRVFSGLAEPGAELQAVQERVQWKLDRVNRRWEYTGSQRQQEWRLTRDAL